MDQKQRIETPKDQPELVAQKQQTIWPVANMDQNDQNHEAGAIEDEQRRSNHQEPLTWPAATGELEPVDVTELEGRLNFRLPLVGMNEAE